MWSRARGRVGRNNRRRLRVAQRGERAAERLLKRAGYTIVARQVTGRWSLEVDGKPIPVHARADLIVRRGRQTWVADVKTGASAPNPALPATRRQLLEYLFAFDVDGALIVDMSARRIREVSFPRR